MSRCSRCCRARKADDVRASREHEGRPAPPELQQKASLRAVFMPGLCRTFSNVRAGGLVSKFGVDSSRPELIFLLCPVVRERAGERSHREIGRGIPVCDGISSSGRSDGFKAMPLRVRVSVGTQGTLIIFEAEEGPD
jgi:hypothetical protein